MEPTHTQMRHLLSFFVQSIRERPQDPVVISEGDSWFSFPGHANLIDHLDELVARRMSLLRLESSGDELVEILDSGGISALRRLMERHRPDVLLMSGGGNDIVGPELVTFIARRGATFDAQAAVSTATLTAKFNEMHAAYLRFIAARDAVAPSCVIVTHGYGDVIPSGRKARVLGFTAGPWMKPFLETQGYRDPGEQRLVMRALLGRFNQMLDTLVGPRFVKADLSPAIGDDEWNDEIHPTRKGFEDAARILHATLQQRLPTKFP
jgi:lysophospholipase L1-like esterase